jgi:hypothetical protein
VLDRIGVLPIFLPGAAHQSLGKTIDSQGMTKMIDLQLVRMQTHRNNIARYQRLLETHLTDYERQFIERRLVEEQSNLNGLSAKIFAAPFNRAAVAHQAF